VSTLTSAGESAAVREEREKSTEELGLRDRGANRII
jgi:hypothetical protein